MKSYSEYNKNREYSLKYLNYYQKDKAIPIIIDLLNKEGYDVDETNIKNHSKLRMSLDDIIRGIKYVRLLGKNCIIFTNKVPLKDRLIEDITIKQNRFLELAELFGF